MDLLEELAQYREMLAASREEMREAGYRLARAEKEYKIKLKQETLKLRAEGMAVSIIDKIVYGVDVVAEAKMLRDIASTDYEVAKESINDFKLNIRILENQVNRDYGYEGRQL